MIDFHETTYHTCTICCSKSITSPIPNWFKNDLFVMLFVEEKQFSSFIQSISHTFLYTYVVWNNSRLSSYCRNTVFLRIIYTPSLSQSLVYFRYSALPFKRYLIHLFDFYIHTFIYKLREYGQDIVQIFHTDPTPTPIFHYNFHPQPPPLYPQSLLVKNYGSTAANVAIISG